MKTKSFFDNNSDLMSAKTSVGEKPNCKINTNNRKIML